LCASFSIPEVFPFKKIKEKYYWDGAFTRNPAILPMIDYKLDEIWVVRLLPEKGKIPENKDELKLRMNEITVNNSTNLELEFIEKLNDFSKTIPEFKNYFNKIEIKQARLDIEIQSYSALFADKKFIRKLWQKGIEDSKIFIN
jgi:NTE family protein